MTPRPRLGAIAKAYGLEPEEVHRALRWALIAKAAAAKVKGPPRVMPPSTPMFARTDGRIWCTQCDRRVTITEGVVCERSFCKAKPS